MERQRSLYLHVVVVYERIHDGGFAVTEPDIRETMRQVLIGVCLALAASIQTNTSKVASLLQLFADGTAANPEAKEILREIASSVEIVGHRAKLNPS